MVTEIFFTQIAIWRMVYRSGFHSLLWRTG